VRAEINSHQFGLGSSGSADFQAVAQRIHRLLFGEDAPGAREAGLEAAKAVHA
jgi:NitT/TauT family transport system ATP-binding protein